WFFRCILIFFFRLGFRLRLAKDEILSHEIEYVLSDPWKSDSPLCKISFDHKNINYTQMKLRQSYQTVAYRGVYWLIYVLSLTPMGFLYALASFTFFLTYCLNGYRKEVVIQNIARSFPTKQYGEIRAIEKKFYSCFVSYFAEIIKAVSAPVEVLDKKISFENLELIDGYIKSNRPVIACLGHCGNWEMLNFMPYKMPHETYAVYKPLRSGIMNRLMIKIRSRFGMKLLSDNAVVRH